jgi:hypothetical protein
MFQDEISILQLENDDLLLSREENTQELSVLQVIRNHNATAQQGCIVPVEDVFTVDDCQQSTASSSSSEEWANVSLTRQGMDWSGATLTDELDAEIS